MRALQDWIMATGAALASFSLLVLFPIGDPPPSSVGVTAFLESPTMCRTEWCAAYDFRAEDTLNCMSLELQRAGFAMTRFTSFKRGGLLNIARGEYRGTASVTSEASGYRFDFVALLSSRPHAHVDEARAFANNAFTAVATRCGALSEPQEICTNADCPGEPPTHHEMTIAYIAGHVAASARYVEREL